ncbi:MAG: DNA alkylation repair protein [Anaerovoracaceae bacterium]
MEKVTNKLFELQDLGYRDFNSKLIPTVPNDRVIGIRTPVLRKYAKEFAKDNDSVGFMKELPHYYFDENNLHGYLIENITNNFDETIEYVEEFLPYIDNWATCDTFSPKVFKKNKDKLYNKTKEWMKSDKTYTVRFGIVTQLRYFLDEKFDCEILEIMADIHSEEYYINMAIAWYYSFALIKQYKATIPLFEARKLDTWIHNKSLQKAIESYRIDKETKDYLRSLKIKK